uniref:F-box domain-containing protein n=1 Tax=Strongyloides papillosus TaxID=174720 RepID=A0A0N5C9G7_STREA
MAQSRDTTEKEFLASVGEPIREASSDAEHLLDGDDDVGDVSTEANVVETVQEVVTDGSGEGAVMETGGDVESTEIVPVAVMDPPPAVEASTIVSHHILLQEQVKEAVQTFKMAQSGDMTEKELLGEPVREASSDAEHLLDGDDDVGDASTEANVVETVQEVNTDGSGEGAVMETGGDVESTEIVPVAVMDPPPAVEASTSSGELGTLKPRMPPRFWRPKKSLYRNVRLIVVLSNLPAAHAREARKADRARYSEDTWWQETPAARMKKPMVPVVNEAKMQALQQVVADYAVILNGDTRTIEAQLLLKDVGLLPKHPLAKRMIMAETSFILVRLYQTATSINTYRASLESTPIVDYRMLNLIDTIPDIWNRNQKSPFIVPNWEGMRLVYAGRSVSGPLPRGLKVLILENFVHAVDVKWRELLWSLTKLQILVLDDCELAHHLSVILNSLSTMQAVVCMRGRECNCYRSPIGTKFWRTIEVVPAEQNNNHYFNEVVFQRSGRRFHTRVKVYYNDDRVLEDLCAAELPDPVAEAWNELQERRRS